MRQSVFHVVLFLHNKTVHSDYSRFTNCKRLKSAHSVYIATCVFSTSDSSNPDVLLLSKVRNLEVSGADRALIGSETSHDWERIRSGSGVDPLSLMWSLWANQRLRKSEWIRSRSAPIAIRSQNSCDLFVMANVLAQMCHKSLTSCSYLTALSNRSMLESCLIGHP